MSSDTKEMETNNFYNWSTPNVEETRVMEYLCLQEDKALTQQLYDDIINKLCSLKNKPKGIINVPDNDILGYLKQKMSNVEQWDMQKIYSVCSSVKYRHIVELIYAIKKKSNKVENRKIRESFNTAAEVTNGKILDVGCLDENLTRYVCGKLDKGFLHDKIYEQHGIDVKEWQGENRHVVDEKNFVYFTEVDNEYSSYPYPDNNFFMITCFQVLHHIQNPVFILSEIYRVIAPGGYVIIKEHDIPNANTAALCYISHIIRKYLITDIRDDREYPPLECKFRSRHEWDKLFHQAGFNIVSHYYQPNNTIGTYYTMLQK
jgi:SAM-dependent methyltransferase